MIGKLDQIVTFEAPSESKNAMHEKITTWSSIAQNPRVWAQIIPLNGSEKVVDQKLTAMQTISIKIRSRDGLNAKMRVKHGTTYYQLTYVPPRTRSPYMILQAHKFD